MARGFFGRDAERADALAHLARGDLVVVLRGPPGVRKSALARELADELARDGRDVRVVALDHARDRGEVLAAIARPTGVRARATDPRVVLERIARELEGRRAVLVLDNIGQVAVAVREIALDLVDGIVDLSVLATSRQPLGAALEVAVTLAPLPCRTRRRCSWIARDGWHRTGPSSQPWWNDWWSTRGACRWPWSSWRRAWRPSAHVPWPRRSPAASWVSMPSTVPSTRRGRCLARRSAVASARSGRSAAASPSREHAS